MKNETQAALLRRDLDDILKLWRRVPLAVPKRGWIFNVREALGMKGQDLARRMNVSQAAVAKMERSEEKGVIQLATLRRAARALNCTLVYALAPKGSLENILDDRRRAIAFNELATVVPLKELIRRENRGLIAAYARKVKRRNLWREKGKESAGKTPMPRT